jgi:hypothetical protein
MHVRFPLIGAVAILVMTAEIVGAQGPALGDIALCNEEATRKTGGSALPGPRPEPDRETRYGTGASGLGVSLRRGPRLSFRASGEASERIPAALSSPSRQTRS